MHRIKLFLTASGMVFLIPLAIVSILIGVEYVLNYAREVGCEAAKLFVIVCFMSGVFGAVHSLIYYVEPGHD